MNPISWRPEHQAALVAFTLLGGIGGMLAAWFTSPIYVVSSHTLSGEWADTTGLFKIWVGMPHAYWLWSTFGGGLAGLLFFGVQMARLPR